MALTAAQLAQLKTEINTDPQTYGYAAWVAASEPENVAAALNKVRDGTDGEAAILVRRLDVSAIELLEAVDTRDFIASPNSLQAAWFESVTQNATVRLANPDGTQNRVKNNLDRVLNDTQGSQTRLNALARRNGSRAEQLFGTGATVSVSDVQAALALP